MHFLSNEYFQLVFFVLASFYSNFSFTYQQAEEDTDTKLVQLKEKLLLWLFEILECDFTLHMNRVMLANITFLPVN